jgi:hypothetical protein
MCFKSKGDFMKKQVPEVPKEQQIDDLINQLKSNDAFRQHRGRLRWGASFLSDLASKANSPSAFCRNWDALTGDLRVIGNMMAKLSRDDREFALSELTAALSDADHLFPGESHPIEKTVPVTLLMLDPDRTLLMIRWILECHWGDLGNYLDVKRGVKIDAAFHKGERQTTTETLFAKFPSLEEETWKRIRGSLLWYVGPELFESHRRDVDQQYGHFKGGFGGFGGKNFKALTVGWTQYNDDLEINYGKGFAYFVEADQKEVLSFFTRAEQKTVATWQFRVIPETTNRLGHVNIGLHPESQHAHWERECVGATSLGFSQGLGAVMYPPEEYQVYRGSHKKEGESPRFILGQAR